ncbi:MAG: TusE/DsrC/DsvC family sulfur relay protein [Actinobacteria bacterium]|nr:MAG: TusE/DsrC/DsvC family sulfur relay protein [Actinomycetota bacterium]REK40548.1 MAG: TusE/DsrC/DsvC family sulfur relay protein [Actinomycetota bacterium]
MSDVLVAGTQITLDDEGFLTDPSEWSPDVASELAANIGLELSDEHWAAINFARTDFEENGETPTLRRMAQAGGVSTKEMFRLFPKKPAKKMAYVAGLPKPVGCV